MQGRSYCAEALPTRSVACAPPNRGQKMVKKKATHNAFYYFMLDFRKREESNGKYYANMNEVSNAAGKEWSRMTETEKKPYDMKARDMKQKGAVVKYTSLGEDVEMVRKREEQEIKAKKTMETNIENMIRNNMDNDGYADMKFYVGYINHYCYCNYNNRYYPAEIAIVRFTLREGVDSSDVFHVIIDSGDVPIGYRLAAQKTCEESHQIPPPPHNDAKMSKTDIPAIIKEIFLFMQHGSDDAGKLPPLFIDHNNMVVAQNVFRHLILDNTDYDDDFFKVYPLPYLFFCMRNAAHLKVADEQAFPTISIPITELEKDVYDYVKGICCPYHSVSDAYPFCSLSKAIRSCYIICDHCCSDLGIDLIPGYHVPTNAMQKMLTSRPPTRVSTSWDDPPLRPASNVPQSSAGPSTSSPLRRPMTLSRVMQSTMAAPSNYESDFPSLGGSSTSSASSNNGAIPRGPWGARASGASSTTNGSLSEGMANIAIGRGRGRFLSDQQSFRK